MHRNVSALQITAEPLPQLAFERSEVDGQLGGEVEEAVIDGPNLDPEPAPGHRSLGGAEPGHAERQGGTPDAGKPKNVTPSGVLR